MRRRSPRSALRSGAFPKAFVRAATRATGTLARRLEGREEAEGEGVSQGDLAGVSVCMFRRQRRMRIIRRIAGRDRPGERVGLVAISVEVGWNSAFESRGRPVPPAASAPWRGSRSRSLARGEGPGRAEEFARAITEETMDGRDTPQGFGPGDDSGSGPRHSILFVDDDRVFRERIALAFEKRGFDVRQAQDFDEAVASARKDSPELAVVDLRMPGKNGLQVVQALKEIDETTQILVLTGYGSIATAIDAVRLGAANYIPKPADADDILNAFARAQRPTLEPEPMNFQAPSLARAEWEHIQRVLSDCGGNISEAARRLGIHRRSLQRKLQKYAPKR